MSSSSTQIRTIKLGSKTHKAGMRIQPQDVEVPKDDSFKHDLLDRHEVMIGSRP